MPFLAEKITGMLYRILSLCADEERKDAEKNLKAEMEKDLQEQLSKMTAAELEKYEKRKRLKQKIIALGRMNAMLGTLRANSEVIL